MPTLLKQIVDLIRSIIREDFDIVFLVLLEIPNLILHLERYKKFSDLRQGFKGYIQIYNEKDF